MKLAKTWATNGKVFFSVILLPILMIAISNFGAIHAQYVQPRIKLVYFYENVCGSCNPEREFIELYNDLVGNEKDNVEVDFFMYNTYFESGLNIAEQYYKKYEIPKHKQYAPVVFIGNYCLIGRNEIESKLKEAFTATKEESDLELNEWQPVGVLGKEQAVDVFEEKSSNVTSVLQKENVELQLNNFAVYFYVTACNECTEVSNFFKTAGSKLQNIRKYNIGSAEGLQLAKKYFQAYNVSKEKQTVPVIFFGDTYLLGAEEIKKGLLEQFGKGLGSGTPDFSEQNIRNSIEVELMTGYKTLGVLTTGVINGLNPCSVSLILFFLSLMVAQNINVLKMGFTFIFGKFVTYFLLGTLLFNLINQLSIPWFQSVTKIFMLLFILIITILNILDFIAARNEDYSKIRMQLPVFLRKQNHQWIKRFAATKNGKPLLILCFGLGALIATGEFLCTGQIYLATIIIALQKSQVFNIWAVVYFLLYTFAFISPLLLVTILIYKGRGVFEVSEFFRERMHVIKLVNTVVFVIFGIIVLIWF